MQAKEGQKTKRRRTIRVRLWNGYEAILDRKLIEQLLREGNGERKGAISHDEGDAGN